MVKIFISITDEICFFYKTTMLYVTEFEKHSTCNNNNNNKNKIKNEPSSFRFGVQKYTIFTLSTGTP